MLGTYGDVLCLLGDSPQGHGVGAEYESHVTGASVHQGCELSSLLWNVYSIGFLNPEAHEYADVCTLTFSRAREKSPSPLQTISQRHVGQYPGAPYGQLHLQLRKQIIITRQHGMKTETELLMCRQELESNDHVDMVGVKLDS